MFNEISWSDLEFANPLMSPAYDLGAVITRKRYKA